MKNKKNIEIVRIGKNKDIPVIIEVGSHSIVDDIDESIRLIKDALNITTDNRDDEKIIKQTGDINISISPWGDDNNFPTELAKYVYSTYKAPRLLEFISDQIYGKGPFFINRYSRQEADLKESRKIYKWLESWNYEEYLEAVIADYAFSFNCFSGMKWSNGAKLGYEKIGDKSTLKISSLYHIEAKDARLELKNSEGISPHVVIGDWLNNVGEFKSYQTFDPNTIPNNQVSVFHSKRKISHFRYYSYPGYRNVLETWLPIANKIPAFHKSLLDNGINAKYHIEVSKDYVEITKSKLERIAVSQNKSINDVSFDSALEEVKADVINKLDECMVGSDNVGKYFLSPMEQDADGKSIPMIKITPIENKVKELSESNLKLNEQVNSEFCSAFGVDPSLASIYIGNKMSSGSEILNAYNVHQQSKTNIPRVIVCRALNAAIKLNFPDTDLDLSFRDTFLVKQETNKTGVLEGGKDE